MSSHKLFTEQLRASSRSQHAIADALVVAKLIVAFTNRALYGAALGRFYHVYKAIESSLEQTQEPALQPIRLLLPSIKRQKMFENDLEYFLGPQWGSRVKPTREVQAFVDHIKSASIDQPHLLAAHSYAMHSALLAGGQLIKRMLTRHMQLDDGKGTAVFDYQDAVKPLRAEYKTAINSLPEHLTKQQAHEVLEEHSKVFEYNIAIVKTFNVGYGQYASALLQFVPRWVYVALLLAIIAVGTRLWVLYT